MSVKAKIALGSQDKVFKAKVRDSGPYAALLEKFQGAKGGKDFDYFRVSEALEPRTDTAVGRWNVVIEFKKGKIKRTASSKLDAGVGADIRATTAIGLMRGVLDDIP